MAISKDIYEVSGLKGFAMVKAAQHISDKYIDTDSFRELLLVMKEKFKDKHEYLLLTEIEESLCESLMAVTERMASLEQRHPKFSKKNKPKRRSGKKEKQVVRDSKQVKKTHRRSGRKNLRGKN